MDKLESGEVGKGIGHEVERSERVERSECEEIREWRGQRVDRSESGEFREWIGQEVERSEF